jgi:HTH-type transcriptional regulator / antitoxin HipB
MKKKQNKNLTSLADHIEQQYGVRGTLERERFEEGFEAFKLGVMLQELRKGSGRDGFNKHLKLSIETN